MVTVDGDPFYHSAGDTPANTTDTEPFDMGWCARVGLLSARRLMEVAGLRLAGVLCGGGDRGRRASRAAGPPAAGAAPSAPSGAPTEAARLMARSLASVKALRLAKSLPIDPALDPNATGIVGEEFTPLTTSLGDVESKRTSANPAFAAVMVGYFRAPASRRGTSSRSAPAGRFPASPSRRSARRAPWTSGRS